MSPSRRRAPRAPTVSTRRATFGSHRTRVLEVPGEGPLVLLLHGFSDSADTWRSVMVQLSRLGQRAVAVDLPGFGAAGPIPRGPMLPELDAFVADVLAELGDGGPAIVVGNSMGGTVALRAGEGERPDVGAVVALAPAGLGFKPFLHSADRALTRLVPLLRVAYRTPYPRPVVHAVAALYYRQRLAPGTGISDAWRFASHIRGMGEFRRIGALGRVLMTEIGQGCIDAHAITVPTLLIWGADDPVCDVAGAKALLDAVPGSQIHVLQSCGHLPQVQHPGRVAELLTELVSTLPRPESRPEPRTRRRTRR